MILDAQQINGVEDGWVSMESRIISQSLAKGAYIFFEEQE